MCTDVSKRNIKLLENSVFVRTRERVWMCMSHRELIPGTLVICFSEFKNNMFRSSFLKSVDIII